MQRSTRGTPQGAVISPLLANIYLHYAYDQWVHRWRKRHAVGAAIAVRYADDAVVDFEHRADAERFLAEPRERVAKSGQELQPEKTRLIEFGRRDADRRTARGEGKTETSTSWASRIFVRTHARTASCWPRTRGETGRWRSCRRSPKPSDHVGTRTQRNKGHGWARSCEDSLSITPCPETPGLLAFGLPTIVVHELFYGVYKWVRIL